MPWLSRQGILPQECKDVHRRVSGLAGDSAVNNYFKRDRISKKVGWKR